MEVIMKTLSAGPYGVVSPDERVTVSKKQAKELVNGGFGQYETAAVEIPEKRGDASPAEEPDASGDGPEASAVEAAPEKSGADEPEKKGFVAAVKKAAARKSKKK